MQDGDGGGHVDDSQWTVSHTTHSWTGLVASSPWGRAASAPFPAADSMPSALLSSEAADIQAEFRSVQDAYARVRLSNDLHFVGSQKGLRAESREVAAIISNSARYTEVSLEVLLELLRQSKANPGFHINKALDEVVMCQVAQLKYLQEEQAALFVQGQFGKKTHTLFRQFNHHTTAFNSSDIEVLRAATQLASVPPEPVQQTTNFRGHGHGSFNFCGCGGFSGRGRGGYQPSGYEPKFSSCCTNRQGGGTVLTLNGTVVQSHGGLAMDWCFKNSIGMGGRRSPFTVCG